MCHGTFVFKEYLETAFKVKSPKISISVVVNIKSRTDCKLLCKCVKDT